MPLISEDVVAQLKEEFKQLKDPVRLLVFSQALADPNSEQVKRLVEELGAIDDRLKVESYNLVIDTEKVAELGIARSPAIAVLGENKDFGVRMYGAPSGFAFGALIDAILDISTGESLLQEATIAALTGLARPVHQQVFSSPT